ncbi:hypothetical protein COM27_05650 [Bacillus wiedmannii]|uniref:Uncharacterized protein n=1 Tax=Bacillus wiedmannii TaxID=1890302 RepID=A0A2B6SB72_9BACI|nr:hypothetical protein COM27_05650 [Bacillus wiedmannii]
MLFLTIGYWVCMLTPKHKNLKHKFAANKKNHNLAKAANLWFKLQKLASSIGIVFSHQLFTEIKRFIYDIKTVFMIV